MHKQLVLVLVPLLWLAGCGNEVTTKVESADGHEAGERDAFERGPHGGRLLEQDGFAVELAIFETGVPPEFRAWVTWAGAAVAPDAVQLTVELTRLGGTVDRVSFAPAGQFLRGNREISEPHSFDVTVTAGFGGRSYQWAYASHEGRTRIEAEVAEAAGIGTAIAGPGSITETLRLFGSIVPDATRVREIRARFPGVIRSVAHQVGDRVRAGDTLALIESNESLQEYAVTAPISGVITRRHAEPGEQTDSDSLFEIADFTHVWAEFNAFPRDRPLLREGLKVHVTTEGGIATDAVLRYLAPTGDRSLQSVVVRVALENPDALWIPGEFVEGRVTLSETPVELAVPLSALQTFRDFNVVFAQVGDEYEVRMLELGRRDSEQVEILGGLEPGTVFVSRNSYLIKADIEKSGASHDH